MRHTNLDIDKFKDWIIRQGGEIIPNTSEYELLRFKGKSIGVIYNTRNVSGKFVDISIMEFHKHKVWSGKPHRVNRKTTYRKQKIKILERDGYKCFYYGERLLDDITIEHLISLTSGGRNILGNMVLAHEKCNQEAGNLSVYQKVDLAIKKRNKNVISENNSRN